MGFWRLYSGGGGSQPMSRTIPSFRTVLEMEKEEWKPFRNALSKSEKKKFDEMWDQRQISLLHSSSSSVVTLLLHLWLLLHM
jgi:hypothetical protein